MVTALLLSLVLGSAVRPEVDAEVQKAVALINDLEDQNALAVLDALATRADLQPQELALAEMWRGITYVSINKPKDAAKSFSVMKGCAKELALPPGTNPKAIKAHKKAKPVACPVKEAAAPAPAAAAAPPDAVKADEGLEFTLVDTSGAQSTPPANGQPGAAGAATPAKPAVDQEKLFEGPSDVPAKKDETAKKEEAAPSKGFNVKLAAGGGVAALGAVLLVVAVAVVAGGVGSLVGSFPVYSYGNAQEQVTAYRQGLLAAFIMRVAGVGVMPVAALVLLLALGTAAGGAGLAVWGLLG